MSISTKPLPNIPSRESLKLAVMLKFHPSHWKSPGSKKSPTEDSDVSNEFKIQSEDLELSSNSSIKRTNNHRLLCLVLYEHLTVFSKGI